MATGLLRGKKKALPLFVGLLKDNEQSIRGHAAICIVELTDVSLPAPADLDEEDKATWKKLDETIRKGALGASGEKAIAVQNRYVEALHIWCQKNVSITR